MRVCVLWVVVSLLFVGMTACGGGDGETWDDCDDVTCTEFTDLFVQTALDQWLGEDYTFGGDGSAGIDGAGTVIQTLRLLGYAVPLDMAHAFYDEWTQSNGMTATDLQEGRFEMLDVGDLIFLDYDFDDVYDHVAIYLGAYGGLDNAVLTASDYFDEVVIANLEDYNDPFTQDVTWSQVAPRQLDYPAIEDTFDCGSGPPTPPAEG